ncbi:MAG: biosynthetic-type acetolactate synthase large subunit, partial [Gemmatimonadales bacterium]|nr:biosynthetic-type acetolactate synthase large subunit [Gemmatimonadales bacterium]
MTNDYQLTGAQILCRALLEQGVELVFGYPGGAIMPFYHALPEYPGLRHVLVRHEQAAAHAADGYARASGRPGVCVATSGPGATNLVTGLATAHMDSTPVVAITGQVSRAMMGKDAFQETDIIGITQPITKHSVLVDDVEDLADAVREAFAAATEGRPGPVLVDVPKDVQMDKASWTGGRAGGQTGGRSTEAGVGELSVGPSARLSALDDAIRLITLAHRPLIMAGHGIILSGGYAELRAFAERTGIPVITTLLGISALPEAHPLHLGMPGMHGEVHVNRAIQQADLIVGVGLRFDDRVTGNLAAFARGARVIHIDLDASEIGKNVPVAVGIVGDAREVLAALAERTPARDCDAWREEIAGFVRPRVEHLRGGPSPEGILGAIEETADGRCTIVSDVGQHQMWVAKLYRYQRPNSHITSGGLGTMGFAVPAAMGVAMARPDEPVWAISGDGGFQMNMQEMATMVQENIPVKM